MRGRVTICKISRKKYKVPYIFETSQGLAKESSKICDKKIKTFYVGSESKKLFFEIQKKF
jgi:hypothetical protein